MGNPRETAQQGRSPGGRPAPVMGKFLIQLRVIAWAAVEAAFLLIVLCLLLNIIIGDKPDSFISTVAKNATAFLQSLPPGIFLGLVLLVLIYGFLKSRLHPPP